MGARQTEKRNNHQYIDFRKVAFWSPQRTILISSPCAAYSTKCLANSLSSWNRWVNDCTSTTGLLIRLYWYLNCFFVGQLLDLKKQTNVEESKVMKMPLPSRISDEQFVHLASQAKHHCSLSGKLFIRVNENPAKWQLKWFILYQNFLFYFESEDSAKLSGLIYLEHSVCERLCFTNLKDSENKVSMRWGARYLLLRIQWLCIISLFVSNNLYMSISKKALFLVQVTIYFFVYTIFKILEFILSFQITSQCIYLFYL